ncbi:hypothetical protein LAV73_21345 [Lysinibacillus xylanilyticus]|uniref:hypothetical protein n=1 Tax=Lysinibacillus xylanilyticus TaxID=582475 RepID=UPI002B246A7C|nr:hypothetical protein [Lysinibacillus xylanilyticus]MEB2282494.1 hypothetical protein [Lysinibacillus xylanilyticus]
MMKRYFKQELIYGVNSKIYYMMTLFLILLFGITLFLNYKSVVSTYDEYLRTLNYYEKNNLDIEADLAGEYQTKKTEDGEMISNPILYHKDTVSRYIYAASPKYNLSQLLESSILYFPVVFGILGLLIAINDFKYKTIKLKTVRMNKETFIIAKQLAIAFSSFLILVVGLVISCLIGWIMYNQLPDNLPIVEFSFEPAILSSSMIIKFIFGYIIALLFTELGYTFGTIFKNVYVGMIAIIVYMFILPNLGSFDLKNSIYYFAHKIFDFYGVIAIETPKETTFVFAALVILFVFIISFIANIFVLKKRSSFES